MNTIWTVRLAAVVLVLSPLGAWAQEETTDKAVAQARTAERARINEARAVLQTETQARERACYQQFSVNACLSEARAKRRQLELEKKGKSLPFEEVLRDMEYRDKNDSSRAAAPLRPAEDAVRLDTTQLDFDESCAAVESLIRERFAL